MTKQDDLSGYKYDLFAEKFQKMCEREQLNFSTIEDRLELTALALATDDDLDNYDQSICRLKKDVRRLQKHEAAEVLSDFFDIWISYSRKRTSLPPEVLDALEVENKVARNLFLPATPTAASPEESAQ